ncbi:hypothetical protein [Phyllobacterium myrsinacearum]|uniref:Antifreeze protein n=1 Tax=Phyllobacterium myrsinacearum TaxID=28101 RepID=A0A2S9JDZ6_9HYPH|nr:hypothetical protein [Phyllobacterium myrsinacearum]PRD51115.1 hypothetical protein C5750_19980 [Phyllobacterium myrsinacearum]PWV86683.1 hypothetical protein DEV92_11575 [Phyllobacterium myrsinacearum]RZU97458.1 hypothetical protein EV654_4317 [Phyllobacterium myrsinacearum]
MVGREFKHLLPALAAAIVLLAGGVPAQAVSMKECSAKYKAAQAAGSAKSWNEFRKEECAKAPFAAVGDEAQGAGTQAAPKGSETAGVTKSPVFPSAVSSKFAAEKPARARMHTCLEQYHINKDNNTLGGMRWIEKGGGYYKLCNARLKGTT